MRDSRSSNPLLVHALEYLARGWSIMPVHSVGERAKRPHAVLIESGHKQVRGGRQALAWKQLQQVLPTVGDVEMWFQSPNGKGVAVVTGRLSGLVGIDLDGALGTSYVKRFGLRPHVRTGSGGFHVYLRHPGFHVPTISASASGALKDDWTGIDIRGDGGYAVLPPSRNASGQYVQLRSFDDLETLESLPKELRSLIVPAKKPTVQPSVLSSVEAISLGGQVSGDQLVTRALEQIATGRNNAGFWLATQLRDNGYSEAEASPFMYLFAAQVPLTNAKGILELYTAQDAMRTLRSAYKGKVRYAWRKRNES